MQAQDFDHTLWSLSQRTGQTREQIRNEFDSGALIRTHALRPTWHLVRGEDLAHVQAATAARVHGSNATLYQQTGLTEPLRAEWRKWLADGLANGPLTRGEISHELTVAGRPMAARMLMGALMWAELEMIIGSGPMNGQASTYRLLDPLPTPDRSESVLWLVRTFLSSHGPSTVADIAAWARLSVKEIRAALVGIGAKPVDGPHGTCYALEPTSPQAVGSSSCVVLMNGFDEYVSGLSAAGKALLDPMGLRLLRFGVPRRVIMIDGTLVGTWRRTVMGAGIRLDVLPARPLTAGELRGVAAQARAYQHFVAAPVDVRFP